MKLEMAPQDVAVNGQFETSDFSIGDVGFIVDLLADKIYTDKPLAVVREYCCNAHDSHVMAGTTDKPFNVHLPTMLEPWFSVRDYGTGLCEEDVRGVFSGIGISTKRDSNEVIGCFGVGTLSAFSVADSFTVTSFFNGIKTVYSCYRNDKRQPVVARLASSPTDEPNGLEVNVSINSKVCEFEDAASQVFKFWEGTTPNINISYVLVNSDEYAFKGEDFGLCNSYGSMYAVQGNIAYKIPYNLDEFDCHGYLKFELGELEFDTARENLSITDKVQQKLKEKFASVRSKLNSLAVEQIEQQPTKMKKAELAEKLSSGVIGRMCSLDTKPYQLPILKSSATYWKCRSGRKAEKHETKYIPLGSRIEYYLYKEKMTSRIKEYAKDYNITVVVFNDLEQAKESCIDLDLLKDLDDLPKIVYSRGASRSYSGSTVKTFLFQPRGYRSYDKDSWQDIELEIDNNEIVYVELNNFKIVSNQDAISGNNIILKDSIQLIKEHLGIDVSVYGLKSAFLKTKAFKNGNFIKFEDYIVREFSKLSGITCSVYNENLVRKLEAIDRVIDSQEVKEILVEKPKKQDVDAILEKLGVSFVIDDSFQKTMENFFDKYCMLKIVSDWEVRSHRDEVSKYIGGTVK